MLGESPLRYDGEGTHETNRHSGTAAASATGGNVARMIFTAIPREALDTVWLQARELLESAVRTQEHTYHVTDIYSFISSGHVVLWFVYENDVPIAAICTRIQSYPYMKSLCIDWVGGKKMSKWLDLVLETLTKYAKTNNCKQLEGFGRKAWGRALERHGWKPNYIAYRVDIGSPYDTDEKTKK